MTLQVIQHIELGSAQASIDFTSIPGTYTDLYLTLSLRTTGGSAGGYQTYIKLNGSGTGNSWRNLLGTGSSAVSQNSTSDSTGLRITMSSSNGDTASTFGNANLYFPNYSGSNNKSVSGDNVSENNGTAATQSITAGLWANSAAITTITIFGDATNLAAGSSATLFGVTKGSDGQTTVS